MKRQWLFLNSLDNVTTVLRLAEFYVHEHNCVLPHSAFNRQTLTRCTSAQEAQNPEESPAGAAAARRSCVEANRSAVCDLRSSIDAAAKQSEK